MKNTRNKVFRNWAAVAASLLIIGLFTGCPNAAGGSSKDGSTPAPAPKCEVTFGVEGTPANGELTAKQGKTVLTSPAQVEKGKTVTFKAEPKAGYRVKGWTLDGSPVNGTNSTYSLNITKAVTVKVSFEDDSTPLPKYTVTFSVEGGNGKFKASADGIAATETSPISVAKGKTVHFTAEPNTGYEVKEWQILGEGMIFEAGTGTPKNNTARVRVKADLTVKVVFKEEEVTVKHLVKMTAGEYGSITAAPALSPDGMVDKNTVIIFTAKGNDGYVVDTWAITGGETLSGGLEGNGTAMVKITENVTVHVTFKVSFSVAGTPPNGSISAAYKEGGTNFTSDTSVPENTVLVFTAAPNEDYKVEKWTVNGESVTGNTEKTYEHKVTGNADIKVSFISSVTIPDNFTLTNGEKYQVTDKAEKHVIMTKPASGFSDTVYTINPKVEYSSLTYTLTGFSRKCVNKLSSTSFALSGESEFFSVADGVLFDKAQTKLIRYPQYKADISYTVPSTVTVLMEYSFSFSKNLTSIVLPEGLTTIEKGALYSCNNLQAVNLPSSLSSLGEEFLNYSKVEHVVIPEGVSELKLGFLVNCVDLKTLVLPSTITDITGYYFCYKCTALESITCKAATPPAVSDDDGLFGEVDLSRVTLKVPAGKKAAYQAAKVWKKFGNIVELP